tara:strand:- start:1852 stop:2388 length:537 start_codon:yes stop_codon:yes gene_type:complete
MIDYQNLTNLPEINFKSKQRPRLDELSEYIDNMKAQLFEDKWSTATKKHIKTSLALYIRTMQKQLAPNGAHYKVATQLSHKEHLEHPIPQIKIITAYLHDKLTAQQVLQMPLCVIDDSDKHIFEGEWQTMATWKHPFMRYKLAGYDRTIKNVRGEIIDFSTWTLEDHFKMLGVVDLSA